MKMMLIALNLIVCVVMVFAGGAQEEQIPVTEPVDAVKTEMLSGNLGGWGTVAEFERATGQTIAVFKEAPMLAEMVLSGEIPALKDRLPFEPAVVEPLEEVGTYGGTLKHPATSPTEEMILHRCGYEPLVRWSMEGFDIIPGVAKSWTVSSDGKIFDFFLREGMKWSDGAPFTADDIIFRYEDYELNTELRPFFTSWLTTKGVPVKVEKIGKYQVRFIFSESYGMFLKNIAFRMRLLMPKHYLKQFHPDYVSKDELDKLVAAGGFDEWVELFNDRRNYHTNPEVPVLFPWVVESADASLVTLTRNPYYWKVDTEGNQLPYIDKRMVPIMNTEILTLKALSGELDYVSRYLSLDDYMLLLENQERGGYQLAIWKKGFPAKDIHPEYLDYNPDRANTLLDSLGLKWDKENNYRLGPDGNPLSFVLDTLMTGSGNADFWAMIIRYWKEVGIRATFNSMEALLWRKSIAANETTINPYGTEIYYNINSTLPVLGDLVREKDFRLALSLAINRDEINTVLFFGLASKVHFYVTLWEINPLWHVPTATNTYWAPLYGLWYQTNGGEGEEPTGVPRELQVLFDRMVVTPGGEEQDRLSWEIWSKSAAELYVTRVLSIPYVVLISNSLGNVKKENVIESYRLKTPGPLNPATWFLKK